MSPMYKIMFPLETFGTLSVWYTSNKSAWMERSIFSEYMTFFNNEIKSKSKTGWLLMDNSSTHGLPADAAPDMWEEDGLRLRGFKMSNTNAVYLPANTTSHIQPLDGGIIVNFKGRCTNVYFSSICLFKNDVMN
jgi:hypothetical protein